MTERNVIHMRYLIKSAIVMAACVAATLALTMVPAASHEVLEVPAPQPTPIWCGGVSWPISVGTCIPPWGLVVDGNEVL